MSVPERLDLLCRTDREVALRAAARYIDLLLHHLVNVNIAAFPDRKKLWRWRHNLMYSVGQIVNTAAKL